ncbi:hypothetical protein POM88_043332 [Heracleum sosnowskyi]|uniref:SWIM-type domain-containing protein n=1 Tax=Heracleum sosnowskyi TaxID=360622 RepID=A0AAD8H366_9APIA|nr:hypothetical protein POM88_043332 [Heracleum sosnowskyi]
MDSCSVNDDDTNKFTNVADDACCEMIFENEIEQLFVGGDEFWTGDSPTKPYVGQVFASIDAAFSCYKGYSSFSGFQVRRSTQKTRRGLIVSKYFVCSKAGSADNSSSRDDDDIEPEASRISDTVGPVKKKRRTVSGKCECSAKLVLKNVALKGYVVSHFEDNHNHPFANDSEKHFLRGNRCMTAVLRNFAFNAASSNTGPVRAFNFLKSLTGSYAAVGATAVDFKNWMRDIKVFIGNHDADMILQKFKDKKETSDNTFFYEYETDSNGHLTRIFWADLEGQRSYDVFGDVVSFDATYRTNKYSMVFVPFIGVDNHWKSVTFAAALLDKEDIENFTWVFKMFLKIMKHPPKCIITDQCAAMKAVIPKIFPDSMHRLCMWHILQKFPSKLGVVFCAESLFMEKLNKFVWNSSLVPEEFEQGWHSVLEEYNLSDHSWLKEMFELRHFWIPAYFMDKSMGGLLRTTSRSESSNFYFNHFVQKGDTLSEFYMCYESAIAKQRNSYYELRNGDSKFPKMVTEMEIEKDAASHYTRSIYYKVRKEIKAACYHMSLDNLVTADNVKKCMIRDKHVKDKVFQVDLSLSSNDISCSCHLLTRVGYPCRHIFYCLSLSSIEQIPQQLLSKRWMKNAVETYSTIDLVAESNGSSDEDKRKSTSKEVWFEFQGCVDEVSSDVNALGFVLAGLKCLRAKAREMVKNPQMSKKDVIANMFGVKPSAIITIKPPLQSNNKGSRKRIVGPAEKSADGRDRVRRMCKICKKKSYHDSRNCPKKGLENNLSVHQVEEPLNGEDTEMSNPQ